MPRPTSAAALTAAPGFDGVGLCAVARLVERGQKQDCRAVAGQEVVEDLSAVDLYLALFAHLHLRGGQRRARTPNPAQSRVRLCAQREERRAGCGAACHVKPRSRRVDSESGRGHKCLSMRHKYSHAHGCGQQALRAGGSHRAWTSRGGLCAPEMTRRNTSVTRRRLKKTLFGEAGGSRRGLVSRIDQFSKQDEART